MPDGQARHGSSLVVLPTPLVNSGNQPVATIMDNKPMANVPPFGMCTTPSNPQVAAATSAALGVLTPQPCMPVIAAPWAPGSATVMVGEQAGAHLGQQLHVPVGRQDLDHERRSDDDDDRLSRPPARRRIPAAGRRTSGLSFAGR